MSTCMLADGIRSAWHLAGFLGLSAPVGVNCANTSAQHPKKMQLHSKRQQQDTHRTQLCLEVRDNEPGS